jgi:plastocyanin
MNGSESVHAGSTIKAETKASLRSESIAPYGTVVHYAGGGSITLPTSRRQEGIASKNERKKLAKELRMARVFAHAGYKIDFTPKGAGTHDVFINGIPADFKRLSSTNNIIKDAKHAISKQGAKLVLFEFTSRFKGMQQELNRLRDRGIHGKYFISKQNRIYDF